MSVLGPRKICRRFVPRWWPYLAQGGHLGTGSPPAFAQVTPPVNNDHCRSARFFHSFNRDARQSFVSRLGATNSFWHHSATLCRSQRRSDREAKTTHLSPTSRPEKTKATLFKLFVPWYTARNVHARLSRGCKVISGASESKLEHTTTTFRCTPGIHTTHDCTPLKDRSS